MISTQSGSIRLFRVAGIQVYLHWSWLLVAWWQISTRGHAYSSPVWNVAEYVSLFVIVLLHEFGHSFASRSVGGEAKEILLWPFGGIAFVKVPPRAGAELWSIAAGPLVNVAFYPLLMSLVFLGRSAGWSDRSPDFDRFLVEMWKINKNLLIFNLLPIYPLDGGQILRSLLWFGLGRARSLQIASAIGLVSIAAAVGWVVWQAPSNWMWTAFMGFFLGQQCLRGWKHAQSLQHLERLARHRGFACPVCRAAPPGGPLWLCGSCRNRFDPFSTQAVCPHCQTRQPATPCPSCGAEHPIEAWAAGQPAAVQPPVIDI